MIAIRRRCVLSKAALLTAAVVFLLGFSCCAAGLRIFHFDVGQADCSLLVSPGGSTVLFDCGDANWNSNRECTNLAPLLEVLVPSKHLDFVVIFHFNVDRVGYVGYGGLYCLLENFGFSVGTTLLRDFVAFPGDASSKTLAKWAEYIETHRAEMNPRTPQLGEVIDLWEFR